MGWAKPGMRVVSAGDAAAYVLPDGTIGIVLAVHTVEGKYELNPPNSWGEEFSFQTCTIRLPDGSEREVAEDRLLPENWMELAGTANCGCVHHAEQGIPCIHDLTLA